MFVLSRKKDEKLTIGANVEVHIVAITGDTVRLGVVAPLEVPIRRSEVYEAIPSAPWLNQPARSAALAEEQPADSLEAREAKDAGYAGEVLDPYNWFLKELENNVANWVPAENPDVRSTGDGLLSYLVRLLQSERVLTADEVVEVVWRALGREVCLESLEGFVDQIDGNTAYVVLRSEHGDELYGEYPADQLAAKGITERRRFTCRTIEAGGDVRVELMPVPDVELSAEEEQATSRRIDDLLAGNELDGDY